MDFDRKNFWDKKILGWESDRYKESKTINNSSLQYRLNIIQHILKKLPKNSRVLEIGCGSALSLDLIKESRDIHYTGIDISERAIENAKSKYSEIDNFNFIATDISNFTPNQEYDFCFSLGLLDWISLSEIKQIKEKIQTKYYLHSYSEKRQSIEQFIHQIYVFIAYAYKTKNYKPAYYSQDAIGKIFHRPSFYRNKKLSFGTLVYNLPTELKEDILL
ncbi:MAG: hypothetical protein COW01_00255 [Bdellovibrionales bacterium CG12_big_fil_rev_8_21_14_0_65_38_15]|nr:MAG: hypothetical protein COW79_14145 [Bdellovibrionales bacterium CG22_combo_CG10-13_8_21_14_all_38_13]PIQ57401.1 MAG: hypothetical protein COW01_00255 [Bdellovibrionales bacterium CG12_big_fil_rev_8_21_14_0_65_38_15]PIR31121.1 MAG: hypothetical protein COV38_01735 [Bdellovibrionales bacterium CG11_big_fil_rev_8_21_14_0_20_38_13]